MVPVGLNGLLEERETKDSLLIGSSRLEISDNFIDWNRALLLVEEVVREIGDWKGLP